MEFPHLGKHCAEDSCNRLDFLPFQCDGCSKVFCSTHFQYKQHACTGAYKKDVQVPVCPLCGEPVPTAPGVEPDLTVGQHIDKQCKSDSKKIFTNRCTYKGCKKKELVPIQCSMCKQNFCLRHRHTSDHDCKGSAAAASASSSQLDARTMAANAAEYRRTNKPNSLFNTQPKPNANTQRVNRNQMQTIQGNISEDEALARALALSIMELDETADRNRRNEAAAAAAAAATNTQQVPVGGTNSSQQGNNKDKCSLS